MSSNAEILKFLKKLPPEEIKGLLSEIETLNRAEEIAEARERFLPFVRKMWPSFIEGAHSRIMADAFERVVSGKLKRLMIHMPPRHGKSELTSFLLPAWFFGKYPNKKVIQSSHTAELCVGFGRKVRNLVQTPEYREVFPDITLRADSKAAGRWETSQRGEYFAIGVDGAVTGKGADLFIIDDPHALSVDTEIPTPGGFVKIKDISVGDCVFGPDGKPTKVIGKSAVYERELYAVETSDGQIVECDGGHLWSIRDGTGLHRPNKVITTRELASWSRKSKACLPRHSAVEYREKDFLVHPWVLGAWLGDGTSSLGRMTAHPNDSAWMRGQFETHGYKTATLADPYSFGVYGLMQQLRQIGVLNNKHVPDGYFEGSKAQRLALLHGLMDTDGTVSADGQCVFSNDNLLLASAVQRLLHGLGLKASIWSRVESGSNRSKPTTAYRVCFRMTGGALMPRKRARTKGTNDKRCRSVTARKTNRKGLVQCITVERDDGLFLAGRGYVVTHNSEQQAKSGDPSVYDAAYDWYVTGPRQRLQPGAAIIVVATRWSKRDLPARLIKASQNDPLADRWEVIEFPAIMPDGRPLWPEFWSASELAATRASMPPHWWQAAYQQQPTSGENALVKREWWQTWEGPLPKCDYIIQSWDTSFGKNDRANPSACTTWGLFEHSTVINKITPLKGTIQVDDRRKHVILLDAFAERLDFPALKTRAKQEYQRFRPDCVIIEGKASGMPLITELRLAGLPIEEYTPTRGNDKTVRVNSVADLFQAGVIWAQDARYANEVKMQFSDFPSGEFDDLVDSSTQALIRLRQGGLVRLHTDDNDGEEKVTRRKIANYY
jgi:predicted phage terminase large subunit-like protein